MKKSTLLVLAIIIIPIVIVGVVAINGVTNLNEKQPEGSRGENSNNTSTQAIVASIPPAAHEFQVFEPQLTIAKT